TPQIHKADGVNVYKVIEPFGFNNFVFMINADGTVSCPPQVIYMHSQYGPVTMRVSSGKVEGDWVVLNVSGYTVDEGSFGGGVAIAHIEFKQLAGCIGSLYFASQHGFSPCQPHFDIDFADLQHFGGFCDIQTIDFT